ncbi:MAG: hypothetical protein HYY63_03305 [Elusimicrobia bacterium]|nr:hypothetical protein [Elusimicrobiota bacterium]
MVENSSFNCCVLLDSFESGQTGLIANVLSEITQIPVFDATQKLAKSFGFLLENCSEDTARKCVTALEAVNIIARVCQNQDLVQLPDFVEIKKALFSPEGISYFTHGSENQFTSEWKNVALISTGVFRQEIISEHTKVVKPSAGAQAARVGLMAVGVPIGFAKEKKVTVKSKETALYFSLDLFLSNPVARIRINPNSFTFDCLKEQMTYSSTTNFRLCVQEIVKLSPSARKNQGTEFILAGKALNLLHYDTPYDLDKENQRILSISGYQTPQKKSP